MSEKKEWHTGVCDVHYWAKNDSQERKVYWCDDCQAWICEKCENNYPLRAIAMMARMKNEMFG